MPLRKRSLPRRAASRVLRIIRRAKKKIVYCFSPQVRRTYYLESLVGPIGYWDELERYQHGFHLQVGVKPYHSVLDIGCGPLQGGGYR